MLAYVVTARGHSNKALLDMARHVKRLQLGGTVVNARAVFDAWWAKSQGNVDPQYTVDEFFMKFRNALDKCRGGDLLERAWEDSVGLMAPGAEVLMDARLQHLAAFCYVLDRANGQEGFFLGCRQLAQLFELDSEYISHVAAWNRLRVLQDCRVIRLVTQGAVSAGDTGSGQANHYAYIGVRQG